MVRPGAQTSARAAAHQQAQVRPCPLKAEMRFQENSGLRVQGCVSFLQGSQRYTAQRLCQAARTTSRSCSCPAGPGKALHLQHRATEHQGATIPANAVPDGLCRCLPKSVEAVVILVLP